MSLLASQPLPDNRPARHEGLDWPRLGRAGNHRVSLHRGSLGDVEDFAASTDTPSGYSPQFQIAFPYLGLFAWRTRQGARTLIDSNKILFVAGAQEFDERHPVRDLGHACVIITPDPALLDELCGREGPARHRAFRDVERPASPLSRLLAHRLRTLGKDRESLAADELTVAAMRAGLDAPPIRRSPPTRIVDRAKQYLHARGFERVTLSQIAGEVGVTAVYLTQAFSRAEGIPLYRYQLQLRLGRALGELPHCDDLTALALDLGFSSHSHFSASFRQMFGMTPSRYRDGG